MTGRPGAMTPKGTGGAAAAMRESGLFDEQSNEFFKSKVCHGILLYFHFTATEVFLEFVIDRAMLQVHVYGPRLRRRLLSLCIITYIGLAYFWGGAHQLAITALYLVRIQLFRDASKRECSCSRGGLEFSASFNTAVL